VNESVKFSVLLSLRWTFPIVPASLRSYIGQSDNLVTKRASHTPNQPVGSIFMQYLLN